MLESLKLAIYEDQHLTMLTKLAERLLKAQVLVTATGYVEACDTLRSLSNIDLILMDQDLLVGPNDIISPRRGHGSLLASKINNMYGNSIPIIGISGNLDTPIEGAAINLLKPFPQQSLVQAVSQLVTIPQLVHN